MKDLPAIVMTNIQGMWSYKILKTRKKDFEALLFENISWHAVEIAVALQNCCAYVAAALSLML